MQYTNFILYYAQNDHNEHGETSHFFDSLMISHFQEKGMHNYLLLKNHLCVYYKDEYLVAWPDLTFWPQTLLL